MKTLVDCGCEVQVHADGSGAEIDYCPLHDAAGAMLTTLRDFTALMDSGQVLLRLNDLLKVYESARAGIAKAERRSAATIFRLAANAALIAAAPLLLEALRFVEWRATHEDEDAEPEPACPACGGTRDNGHWASCALAAAIKAATGGET